MTIRNQQPRSKIPRDRPDDVGSGVGWILKLALYSYLKKVSISPWRLPEENPILTGINLIFNHKKQNSGYLETGRVGPRLPCIPKPFSLWTLWVCFS